MRYRQVRSVGGRGEGPGRFSRALRAIAMDSTGTLYAAGDSAVSVFSENGAFLRKLDGGGPVHSVAISPGGSVYAGGAGHVEIFDGKRRDVWRDPEKLGLVTAIGFAGDSVLLADVKARCIRRYTRDGKFQHNIGKDNRMKGFLVPNGALDFSVDSSGVIHAANPGKHRVERYTVDGELLGHIGRFDGLNPEGFSGCCNPTNVSVAGERIFVTEKAEPRAKVYDFEGNLLAVIADEPFDLACKNMDIAVDARGRVYVADTVKLEILVFEPSEVTT
jgi:hypothetical protein